jgi:hypothetical protein
MVTQLFHCWREPVISRLLGRNWQLWYPRYKTLTVAPEPSVEWVVGAGRLMDGRIGTHMIPWGPPQDTEV